MRILSAVAILGLVLMAVVTSCAPAEPPPSPREVMRERFLERRAAMNGDASTAPVTRVSASTAAAPAQTGAQRVELTVDGQARHFFVHVPANVDATPGVVLALHGGAGTATRFLNSSSLVGQSDQRGFIVVFPDGNRLWNDGRLKSQGGADDVKFLRQVVGWTVDNLGADPARVFATGISNGGMMAAKLACDAPDLVAAIAPIAANFTESTYGECRPGRAVPVVMFSGTSDPLMLYEGGRPDLSAIPGRNGTSLETLISAPKSAELWARLANCGAPTTTNLPDRADDGTTVTRIEFDCPNVQVTLYRINGGGHTWPGGQSASGRMASLVGPTTRDIDANAIMLDFFARYGL